MTSKYCILFILFLLTAGESLADPKCTKPVTICIEGENETRHIANMPVNPGCWKYKTTYECHEESDNNCQSLRDQECSQISAQCKTMFNGACVIQNETYNCPTKKCEMKNIPCGKDIFCAQDNCAATNPVKAKDEDFGKAIAQLSALAAAANEVKDQNVKNPQIFAGKAMECSTNFASGLTKDCCGPEASGFLEGKVLKCDEGEKELAIKKMNGLAIEVGRYCHNELPVVGCTSHHTAYCVFGSRLARIIQNDGRKKQLGISFGEVGDDYAHLDCRGVTKEELSRMDFSNMDFSELYKAILEDAEKKLPKKEDIEQKTSKYTYKELQEKSIKNLPISSEADIGLKAAERIKEFYGDRVKK